MHEKCKEILILLAFAQSKVDEFKPPNCVAFLYNATQLAGFQMCLRWGWKAHMTALWPSVQCHVSESFMMMLMVNNIECQKTLLHTVCKLSILKFIVCDLKWKWVTVTLNFHGRLHFSTCPSLLAKVCALTSIWHYQCHGINCYTHIHR